MKFSLSIHWPRTSKNGAQVRGHSWRIPPRRRPRVRRCKTKSRLEAADLFSLKTGDLVIFHQEACVNRWENVVEFHEVDKFALKQIERHLPMPFLRFSIATKTWQSHRARRSLKDLTSRRLLHPRGSRKMKILQAFCCRWSWTFGSSSASSYVNI